MVADAGPLHMMDASVCVDCLRSQSPLSDLPFPAGCSLSTIVLAELRTGLTKGRPSQERASRFDAFLRFFQILPFDTSAAAAYAEIRADLERHGTPIGPMDLLIAAHAKSLDATLITANLSEFRRVPGLPLVGWRSRKR